MFWANEKFFLLVTLSSSVSTSFTRVKKPLKSWQSCWFLAWLCTAGKFHLWDLQMKVWSIEQNRKLWESQNCFLLNVTLFSKLVDYWKSLVLDNYWEKHFLVYTLPQFFTQPANLGFIKGRNEVILTWMCKAVLPFHLKYKLGCGAKRRPLKL